MANDNTLVRRAQTGDEEAFAALMREHYSFVYGIVIRMVKNPHDAEEVVQDAFLNAYRGLTQLEDATKFKSWLGEIAQNCGRNWLRKQRSDIVSIDEVSEEILQMQDSSDEQLTRPGTERTDSPDDGDSSTKGQRDCSSLLSGGRKLR